MGAGQSDIPVALSFTPVRVEPFRGSPSKPPVTSSARKELKASPHRLLRMWCTCMDGVHAHQLLAPVKGVVPIIHWALDRSGE